MDSITINDICAAMGIDPCRSESMTIGGTQIVTRIPRTRDEVLPILAANRRLMEAGADALGEQRADAEAWSIVETIVAPRICEAQA